MDLQTAITEANDYYSLGLLQAAIGFDDGQMARRLNLSESDWIEAKNEKFITNKGLLRACRFILLERFQAIELADERGIADAPPEDQMCGPITDQDFVNEMNRLLENIQDLSAKMRKRDIKVAFELRENVGTPYVAASFTKTLIARK